METSVEIIPDYLVREIIEGKKYYYKNYRNVLNKVSTREAIMGSSELQSTIIDILRDFIKLHADSRIYKIMAGEVGVHLASGSNFSLDVAVFERNRLPVDRNIQKYFPIAPLYAFEVDIDIEKEEGEADEVSYIDIKSTTLIEAGTQKVIWILTRRKRIIIFEKNNEGSIQARFLSWSQPFQIHLGQTIQVEIEKWIVESGEGYILEHLNS
jgi:Uma2 family endonuclease